MYAYETSLAVSGSVQRPLASSFEKGLQRTRVLDSLILSRLHKLPYKPELLLYTTADGQRPNCSGLFGRTTVLNSLSDLWNAVLKEPRTACCFAQMVDETLIGHNEVARSALELSLLKVKPYDLSSFEHLLEVQERVYRSPSDEQLFIDPLQRFIEVETSRPYRGERTRKKLLLLEGFVEPSLNFEGPRETAAMIKLKGRDCALGDLRRGLQGISELFRQWDEWLGERGSHVHAFRNIFIYSQVRGLLPACWEELRARGVSPEQVRLPQWASYANAMSSYWEFLLAPAASSALIYVPLNGRCHFADWVRTP